MNRRGFLAFLMAAPVSRVLPWNKIARVIAPVAPAAALNSSEIIAATIAARSGALVENITSNNAILKRLKERGRVKWQ